jgi:hypothetical protein
VTTAPPSQPDADAKELLRRILSNLELTETAFQQQIKRRNVLYEPIRSRLGVSPGLEWEKLFFQYYDQLTKSELFEFRQIRAITETTLQTRNRDTLSILEENPALLDAVPRLSDLRTHLVVWLNKYDGVFVNTPEMCVVYVGVEDGVPFPFGIEQSIRDWLGKPSPKLSKSKEPRAQSGEPCPQSTLDRRDLRDIIVQYFNLEELAMICYDLQQDLEDRDIKGVPVSLELVGGSGRTSIVLNLITYLERRGHLGCLEAEVRQLRPNMFP